jgi:hypothetical protein
MPLRHSIGWSLLVPAGQVCWFSERYLVGLRSHRTSSRRADQRSQSREIGELLKAIEWHVFQGARAVGAKHFLEPPPTA